MKSEERDSKMSNPWGWMPVFIVLRGAANYEATVESAQLENPRAVSNKGSPGNVVHQRIGTAIRLQDGSYAIELFAVPLSGKLLMRPPHIGECVDPTQENHTSVPK